MRIEKASMVRLAPTVALSLAASACAGAPRLETPVSAVSSDRLKISVSGTYAESKGLRITGRVRRAALRAGPIWGHLHITGHFADGRAPVSTDVRWNNLPMRGSRSAMFSALLRTAAPREIASVSVEYRGQADNRQRDSD